MRIVSLVPAVTEWLAAFDAAADLVECSHACADVAAADVPAVTSWRPDAPRAGPGSLVLDADHLRALEPGLIVVQELCAMCTLDAAEIVAAFAPDPAPPIFTFRGATWKAVLDGALALGHRIGRLEQAMAYIAAAERGLRTMQDRVERLPGERPSAAVIEWMDPLMPSAHWTPDVLTAAGTRPVLGTAGAASEVISWDALHRSDPDVLLVALCGLPIDEARRQVQRCLERAEHRAAWGQVRAVREGRVFLLDARAFFSRPGPRLYRAAEVVAAVVHGGSIDHGGEPIRSAEVQRL